jgi:tetratricopeptide (TPR) repeat protein
MPPIDPFLEALETALDHLADPAWLGAQSPLASTYVLGVAAAGDPAARGRALRQRLAEAASTLTDDARRLLDAAYFRRKPGLTIVGVARELHMSRAAYYRHRDTVLPELGNAFTAIIQPVLRLEAPPGAPLIGRQRELDAGLAALRAGGTVALAGPAGIGKTTLGSALARHWPSAFWFTFRPPLNDQFDSFVFALASFLRERGASLAWQQLVADANPAARARIVGLLRHDLSQIPERPLLCIDEVDLLRFDTSEHAQLIQLLEELRPLAPLLLMGQQLVIEPGLTLVLRGLEATEARLLLDAHGAPGLEEAEFGRLLASTRGSPALLRLFAALVGAGEPVASALRQTQASPTLEVMVRRVWQRLAEPERELLARVSVHRGRAPLDAYSAHPAYAALVARELIRPDGSGGLSVPTFAREFVHANIAPDIRAALQIDAARIYEQRADFTAAAWHYLAGREPALAVWTWFRHRESETRHGRAAAARVIFVDVAAADLPAAEDRRALALMRAGWLRDAGEADDALRALDSEAWPAGHPAAGFAHLLRGQLHETRGQIDQALVELRLGLGEFERARERDAARVSASIGFAHLRERDMAAARQAAIEAQVQAQSFRGFVETQAGNFAEAREQLEAAVALAERHAVRPTVMREALSRLGTLCWQQGDATRAMDLLGRALGLATAAGDTLSAVYLRINLAAAALTLGRPALALAYARDGLAVALPMRHGYLIAGLSVNAAEACLLMGEMDEAERHARLAGAQEEAHAQPYALTALGRAMLARGDRAGAAAALAEGASLAEAGQDRFALAHALHWLARAQEGDTAAATEARAQGLFAELGVEAPEGD